MKDLRRSFVHEREEPDTNPPKERPKQEQEPYLVKKIIMEVKAWNPNYGDDKICQCGHPYYRHFDTYENMYPIGCKYCRCDEFKEKK